MAKKKGNKREEPRSSRVKTQYDFDDSDTENGSLKSHPISHDSEEKDKEAQSDNEEVESDVVELLTEKRSSTRIAALKSLGDRLRKSFEFELVMSRQDTIGLYVSNCIKKDTSRGANGEAQLAFEVLSLCGITLGEDGARFFADLRPSLHAYVQDDKRASPARAAALSCLSVLNLICAEDEEAAAPSLNVVTDLFRRARGDADVLSAALEAWGVIMTRTSPSRQAGSVYNAFVPVFERLLDHESIDVRMAAGENIALLHHAKSNSTRPSYEDPHAVVQSLRAAFRARSLSVSSDIKDDDEHSSVAPSERHENVPATPSAAAAAGPDWRVLVEKLGELTNDSNKHRSKKDRKHQRLVFRDILLTVEKNEPCSESMTIGVDRHVFTGWPTLIRLDAMREALGSGLLAHFGQNPLLSHMFNIEVRGIGENGMSKEDKKLVKDERIAQAQERARAEDEYRKKERQRKAAARHGDDDD